MNPFDVEAARRKKLRRIDQMLKALREVEIDSGTPARNNNAVVGTAPKKTKSPGQTEQEPVYCFQAPPGFKAKPGAKFQATKMNQVKIPPSALPQVLAKYNQLCTERDPSRKTEDILATALKFAAAIPPGLFATGKKRPSTPPASEGESTTEKAKDHLVGWGSVGGSGKK